MGAVSPSICSWACTRLSLEPHDSSPTFWAVEPSLVSVGVVLDESMLIALEGVEGEGLLPTGVGPVSYEDIVHLVSVLSSGAGLT